MFKKIVSLCLRRAPIKQWQLELGAHLLKKGCGYQIGQIIRDKKVSPGHWRVKVITGLFYNFATNEVTHTKSNRIITQKDIEVSR